MADLKEKVASGALWVSVERFATQIVGFLVGMVLARLLTPQDYGTVAMLSIFFAVAGVFASCGFGNALIQKKDAGDLEFNSVFYTSLAVATVIYVIFFFAAPYIAEFYHTPILCPVTRVSALSFIFCAINGIQGAELSRKMLFHKRFRISLITCGVSAVCGITLAYLGWGVWALVISSLITSIASIIAYWTIIAWRPKLMFSFSVVKGLFDYGWKLSASSLLHTLYMNLYGFIIGRCYTPADLAFVNKGRSMPNLLMSSVDGTINGVSFPALAKLQDDKDKMVLGMRKMIQCSSFVIFPILVLLAICAKPTILLLYGDQWVPAIIYVPIVCAGLLSEPFCSINCNAISALGRSDVFLKMEIVKKVVAITIVVVSLQFGVLAFVLANAFLYAPFAVLVNTYASGKLFGYTMRQQFKDVASTVGLCGLMLATVFAVRFAMSPLLNAISVRNLAYFIQLVVEGGVGVLTYFGFALILRAQALKEYYTIIRPRLPSRLANLSKIMDRMVLD